MEAPEPCEYRGYPTVWLQGLLTMTQEDQAVGTVLVRIVSGVSHRAQCLRNAQYKSAERWSNQLKNNNTDLH